MRLSYREIMECRYIGLFSISKKYCIEPPISSISILIYFVFFRRKFSENSENSENPWTKVLNNNAENSKNSPKILKICQNFAENSLKRRSFLKPSYGIVSYREKNPNIVSISYRVEKKLIALHWIRQMSVLCFRLVIFGQDGGWCHHQKVWVPRLAQGLD